MKPKIFANYKFNPWQYLVLSFLFLISFGTLALKLPIVKHQNGLAVIDAAFTATSAVCVTGLTTVPTSGFNLAGQLVLLLLMQLGAIGIMTITSSVLLSLKGNVNLRHRLSFSQLQENFNLHDANYVLKNILRITFVTEFIGMILLSLGFLWQGLPFGTAVYQGFFHSISAFCNAGFSTYDQSLIGTNVLIKFTIALLIIIGGLGYFVIFEMMAYYKAKRRLSLHSKIVLVVSLFLILAGTLLLYYFQQGQMSWADSFFQSVTARTAGFNSVDLTQISNAGIFLLLILMFIGASPGSTGGGIKTTNFFIMIYAIFSVLKGRETVTIWHRTINRRQILKAFGTAIIYFLVLSIGILLLFHHTNFGFKDTIFEAVSAMGTVGLSLGLTPLLGFKGKIIIIALMFIGRLGPASFAMATINRQKNIKITYPDGDIY